MAVFLYNDNMNKAKLINKNFLTENVVELTFQPENEVKFIPGQYLSIKIKYDESKPPIFRAYSFASAPREDNVFNICVKVIENGRASNWLNSLEVGASIEFMGPMGEFTFKQSNKEALFLATGTGVSTFKSMAENELKNGNKQKMHLILGTRYMTNIFYKEQFEKLAKQYPNFKFTLTLSRPESLDWKGTVGRTTIILENMEIDTNNTEVYICGLKEMIDDCRKILIKKSIPETSIYSEKFN